MTTHRRISQLTGFLLTVLLVAVITLSITSQQSRMAENRNRFESLKADGLELEVSLRGVSQQLAKDVRFMAALPPIQGIVGARAESGTDPEDVWRTRLETIYLGLLEANPNYLSSSYSSVSDDSEAEVESATPGVSEVSEIVDVDRLQAGNAVLVMPKSRLASRETSDFLTTILQLNPGDVVINISKVHQSGNSFSADEMVLAAGTPIYSDIDGNVFGVVTVEADLEETIRDLLVTSVEAGENAYIVNREGKVILHYSRDLGFQQVSVGQEIGELVKAAQGFFAPGQKADHFSNGHEVYGLKIRIDPRHSDELLGVVLTVQD